jgi:hypothetical protein
VRTEYADEVLHDMSTMRRTVPTRMAKWRRLLTLAPFDMDVCHMESNAPKKQKNDYNHEN